MQMECDTLLKSSRQKLQLCFRPHPDPRSEQEVMASQSCESPTLAISGLPKTKGHLDVGLTERHREYYMGEVGDFPRVRAVVSLVSLKSFTACPNTKGVTT
jgi:hypothetical protein